MSNITIPDPVEPLSPSAKLTYVALSMSETPLTTTQIATRLATPESSIRRALRELRDQNLVVCETAPEDLRSRQYTLDDD